jgi:hypothetical protein
VFAIPRITARKWKKPRQKRDILAARAGAGIGIMIQDAFLFLFNGMLAFAARRWTQM